MKKSIQNNTAFIDGQNLHIGTKQEEWNVDLKRFRIYLRDKYHINDAYYFLGYLKNEKTELYEEIQKAGFILYFKEHNEYAVSEKKGNVDTDIVFEVMKNLLNENPPDSIIIVSGDGDYKKMIDYLIKKGKFLKILFPNRKFASSLYKKLGSEFFDYLYNIKSYLEKIDK